MASGVPYIGKDPTTGEFGEISKSEYERREFGGSTSKDSSDSDFGNVSGEIVGKFYGQNKVITKSGKDYKVTEVTPESGKLAGQIVNLKELGIIKDTSDGQTFDIPSAISYGMSKDQLIDMGFTRKDIDAALQHRQLEQIRVVATKDLEKFTTDEGTNLVNALRSGVPAGTILRAGFTRDQLQKAKDWIVEHPTTSELKSAISLDDFTVKYFQEKGWEIPAELGGTFHRGTATREQLLEMDKHQWEAGKVYRDKFGLKQQIESGAVGVGEFMFPAMKAMQPSKTKADVKASEWVWTGVNTALIIAPTVSKTLGFARLPKFGKTPSIPEVPSVRYGITSELGVPIKGSGTGIPETPLQYWKGKLYPEVSALEGKLVSYPAYVREIPMSQSQFIDVLKGTGGYRKVQSLKIYGSDEGATKVLTPGRAYGIGFQESMYGGRAIPRPLVPQQGMSLWMPPPTLSSGGGGTTTLPKIGAPTIGGTSVTTSSTLTMTPEQVASQLGYSTAGVVWWERTADGGFVPYFSRKPMDTKKRDIFGTPISSGAYITKPQQNIISTPAPDLGENTKYQEQEFISPIPVSTPDPIKFEEPPYEERVEIEEPPSQKPPPIPIVKMSGLPIKGQGLIRKHGSRSTYWLKPLEVPEMYVALPTGLSMKPTNMSKAMWKDLLRNPAGVEKGQDLNEYLDMPGEAVAMETPFGLKRDVKVISRRIILKGGATQKPSSMGSGQYKLLNRSYLGKEIPSTLQTKL